MSGEIDSFGVCVLAVWMLAASGGIQPVYGENKSHRENREQERMWIERDQGDESTERFLLLDGSGWQSGIGEAMTATSLPARGDEVWQLHEEHRQEVQEEEELAYREKLEAQRELEWEYLHLPMRSYPGFFDFFQLQVLFPQIEVTFSRIHYVFWVISGGLLSAGMVWSLMHAGSSRDVLQIITAVMLLIVAMGVAARGIRWADYFAHDVAEVLGNMVSVTEQEESHYSHLVKVFHGIQVSLDRARERIWWEQDTPRSRMASFFDPVSSVLGEWIDWLIKIGYYTGCLLLSVLVLLVLLVLAVMEQLRLFLLYIGYSITPLLIGGLTVPLLREGVRRGIQHLLAILCWPVGWVVCFLLGNILAQRLVFAFQEAPVQENQEWYHPSVLAVHIWRAFYEDRHGMFFGVALGICVLAAGLLFGIWWISRHLHMAVAGYSGVVLKSATSRGPVQAVSTSTAVAYRWIARMARHGHRTSGTSGAKAAMPAGAATPVIATGAAKSPSSSAGTRSGRSGARSIARVSTVPTSGLNGGRRYRTRIRNRK